MWHNIIIGCKSEPLYYILIFIEFNVYLKKSVQRFFIFNLDMVITNFITQAYKFFLKKKKKKSLTNGVTSPTPSLMVWLRPTAKMNPPHLRRGTC